MSLDRKVIAIAAAQTAVYALADDGTLWVGLALVPPQEYPYAQTAFEWQRLPALPPAAQCTTVQHQGLGGAHRCELPAGHPHEHRRGAMVWR
jgi:hypothetical protein